MSHGVQRLYNSVKLAQGQQHMYSFTLERGGAGTLPIIADVIEQQTIIGSNTAIINNAESKHRA